MQHYDVFNGDADGLCALHQLRLAEPRESVLVTGVKRDIALLAKVPVEDCASATVLDISMDKNSAALNSLLDAGKTIHYVDHHHPGDIPKHPNLRANIDISPTTCTSLLVDHELQGRYRAWAVAAAFGDNLLQSAREAAAPLNLSEQQLATLERLGTLINYNGYGASLDDLFFAPADLYRQMQPFADPLAFAAEGETYSTLDQGYNEDMAQAEALQSSDRGDKHAIYIFPDARWARRVSGVYANTLVHSAPAKAHAILTAKPDGGYLVSVRAPLDNRTGADALVRQFETGGGRAAAAGINHLPEADLERFSAALQAQYTP
ncbi:MAG: acetyltransferase [Granulosicoccaceae bacterium]